MAEIWLPKSETRAQTTEDGKVRVWTDMQFAPRPVRDVGVRYGFEPPPPPPDSSESRPPS